MRRFLINSMCFNYSFTIILLGFAALPVNSLTFVIPPATPTWTGEEPPVSDKQANTSYSKAVEKVETIEKVALHLQSDEFREFLRGPENDTVYLPSRDRPISDDWHRVQDYWRERGREIKFPTVSGFTGEQRPQVDQEKALEEYFYKEFSWIEWFGFGGGEPQVNKRRRGLLALATILLVGALYAVHMSKSEVRRVSFSEVEEQQSSLVPSLCNFVCQYNYSNSSIPVLFMRMHFPYNKWGVPLWFDFIFLSAAFVGSCFGIIVLGVCGDLIGRKKSLQFSLGIIVVAALLSAVSFSDFYATYWWITWWRFVLGIGIGGCVPLSAVLSNEDTQGLIARALMTGRAFFWCAPGQLAPYTLAWVMLEAFRYLELSSESLRTVFVMNNIILGVGALPALIALYLLNKLNSDGEVFENCKAKTLGRLVEIVQQNPKHCFTLVGTGGSWFLLNIAFYGTWMYIPMILFQLQPQMLVHDVEMQSGVVGLTAIPGILFAISLIRQLGLRLLNVFGFLVQAVAFMSMAMLHNTGRPMMQLSALCLLVFALNSGPSVGTYVLPTLCYPSHIRSTFHAFSAFLGKLGAVIGAFTAEPIMRSLGMPALFMIHACLCVLGALLSVAFLRRDADYGHLDKVNMPLAVKKRRGSGEASPRRGESSPRRGDSSPRSPRSQVVEDQYSF